MNCKYMSVYYVDKYDIRHIFYYSRLKLFKPYFKFKLVFLLDFPSFSH